MNVPSRLLVILCIFAVNACTDDITTTSQLVLYSEYDGDCLTPAHPCLWESPDSTATVSNTTTAPREGAVCLAVVKTTTTGNGSVQLKAAGPLNLSLYGQGALSFWIRTTNASVTVGLRSGFVSQGNQQDACIVLKDGINGFSNSGSWTKVIIPIELIRAANVLMSLDYVSAPFLLSTTGTGPVHLDDIRLMAGNFTSVAPAEEPIPVFEGWTLLWHDEFDQPDGSLPDGSRWDYDLGLKSIGGKNWGTAEIERYTATNAVVFGKVLQITAHYTGGNINGTGNYTSSRIKTQGKFEFTYGKILARIKFSHVAQGFWPAFWLLGAGWPDSPAWPGCGEIDIMECGQQGHFNSVSGTAHWESGGEHEERSSSVEGDFHNTWHTLGVDWDAEKIVWHLDGVPYKELAITAAEQSELHGPFFLIMNVAVGGTPTDFTGKKSVDVALFPVTMSVDWVRVYRKN